MRGLKFLQTTGRARILQSGIVCGLILAFSPAFAAVPLEINYQARITDFNGVPVTGNPTFYFNLYAGGGTDGGGSLVFSESATDVLQATGLANHLVGAGTNLFGGALTRDIFTTDTEIYLQVAVGSQIDIVAPRIRLEAVPFAIVALDADVVTTAATAGLAEDTANLGGVPPSGYSPASHTHSSLAAQDGIPNPALSVDADGKVGVGTNSPQALLDVNGNLQVATSATLSGPGQPMGMSYDNGHGTFRIRGAFGGIDQHNDAGTFAFSGSADTQGFKAGVDGSLTRVEVLRGVWGTNTSTASVTLGTADFQFIATAEIPPVQEPTVETAVYSPPVPLKAGTSYKIIIIGFNGNSDAWYSNGNQYPGGGSDQDLWFRTYMDTGAPAVSLPTYTKTVGVDGDLVVGGSVSATTLTLAGSIGDPPAQVIDRTVPPGQGAATERSELLLFSGNDNLNAYGPDLITLRAPQIRLQTFSNTAVSSIDNPAGSIDRMVIDTTGTVSIYQDLFVYGTASKTGGGSWGTLSDASLKKNVATISSALDTLCGLRGVSYEWMNPQVYGGTTARLMGLIADEVEKVIPQWVHRDEQGRRTLEIVGFEGLTVEAFKEIEARIEVERAEKRALEQKYSADLAAHETKLRELREQIRQMRNRIDERDHEAR